MAKKTKDLNTLLKEVGEFGLIDQIKKDVSLSSHVIEGIGDDTAVVKGTKTKYVLLTTDMMVENRHFTLELDPGLIGRKALACNLSDIAAMGGKPRYALVSLGITDKIATDVVKKIYKGLRAIASEFKVDVVGGDTVFSEKMVINVALYGDVRKEHLVTRRGAKPGDFVFVTGPLGNSFDSGHHLSFIPRLKEANYLVKNFKPTAMIDISDGLAADLGHVLKAGDVGANLYESEIPLRQGAKTDDALLDGEDFELLFTLSPGTEKKLSKQKRLPHAFYLIGEITKKPGELNLIDFFGRPKPIEMKGFSHF